VTADGFGSKDPVASNSTDDGKAQNRRVALLVISK
jgi:outer membrane protein OmpA-like peptidoglycan-associated protein